MGNICTKCGGPLKPDAVKCAFCGASVADMLAEERARADSNNKGNNSVNNSNNNSNRNSSCNTTRAQNNRSDKSEVAPVRVPTSSPTQTKCGDCNIFSASNWLALWSEKRRDAQRLGIILTNLSGLSAPREFISALESYVEKKSAAGIEYCLLDLDNQQIMGATDLSRVENVVKLLRTVYGAAVPDYLLIIGDDSVVPSIMWENQCGDDDEYVVSDLPYITLDTESPWSGQIYRFGNTTQVGRIPTKSETQFAEAVRYFANTQGFVPYTSIETFAYSALEWERTSEVEFAPLEPCLITSPEYTSNEYYVTNGGLTLLGRLSSDYKLLCFNLHGSDASHQWYGQHGSSYPEAFNASLLPDASKGYVVCTEACYGARPRINLRGEQGIVTNALTNGCLAFVGSSKIAYGQVDGGMSCADIIAGTFGPCVMSGMTFGASFLQSLDKLCSKGTMYEEEIKTLAEFALYGDPSGTLVGGKASKAYDSKPVAFSKPQKDESRAITLMACSGNVTKAGGGFSLMNFSTAEQAKIMNMAHAVSKSGNSFMLQHFSTMSNVEPAVYKVVGSDGFRAVYTKKEGCVKSIVKLHMDGEGNVKRIYTSK